MTRERRDVAELSTLFHKLGARDAEEWAKATFRENTQLARFLFLRAAWSCVVSESDSRWIDVLIARAETHPKEPYAGVGQALKSLRARGATDEELTDLVRGTEAEMIFQLCYLLEDPGDLEAEVRDTAWGLFVLDENGAPVEPLSCLHESVLETDPTGREMRPRGGRLV